MSIKSSIVLQIENPCNENWNNMTSNASGKFCNHCQKTVIDVTTWADADFVKFFKDNSKEVCGRVSNRNLNRALRDNSEQYFVSTRYRYKYEKIAAILLALCASPTLYGQEKSEIKIEQRSTPNNEGSGGKTYTISGKVTDETYRSIPFAQIHYQNKVYFSDSSGNFTIISLSSSHVPTTLVCYSENYKEALMILKSTLQDTSIKIVLKRRYTKEQLITVGMVSCATSYTAPQAPKEKKRIHITDSTLDKTAINRLRTLAKFLERKPDIDIDINTYYFTDEDKAIQNANLAYNYLLQLGVDEKRLRIKESKVSKNKNLSSKVIFTIQ